MAGSSEEAKRKAIFAATDAMIRAHNSDPKKTYTMAHTRFSDLVGYSLNVDNGPLWTDAASHTDPSQMMP